MVSGESSAGDFLLLVTHSRCSPHFTTSTGHATIRRGETIAWVLTACLVVRIEFVGLSLIGTEYVIVSPFYTSIGVFLVTDLGNLSWLSVRHRK